MLPQARRRRFMSGRLPEIKWFVFGFVASRCYRNSGNKLESIGGIRVSTEELIVGIDLGTTNSCIACVLNGTVHVIPDEEDAVLQASVVTFSRMKASSLGIMPAGGSRPTLNVLFTRPSV